MIPYGAGVEASFLLGRNVISWRQSKTTGKSIKENVFLRQFARANHGILVGPDLESYTTNRGNHKEMTKEADEWKSH
jgi:hypothetical protein